MSSISNARVATMRGFEFEDLIADLFRAKGFIVEQDARIGGMEVDMLVDHGDGQIPVQVSAVKQVHSLAKLRVDAERLKSLLAEVPDLAQPIVVVGSALTPKAKAWAQSEYLIRVWDLNDLVAQAGHYPSLNQRLQHFIEKESGDAQRKLVDGETDELVDRLIRHIAVRDCLSPSEYERLCMSVFIKLFDPHLYGFERQAETTDGGNRYDFICRILPGNSFWDAIRQDFRTRAILFECKNYREAIGPDQIYSTERYLFAGGLRTVCVLASRLGANDGAIRAAQGAMRESGKLLILLSNQDLVDMLRLKSQDGGVENFLDKRIWDFIISLPR